MKIVRYHPRGLIGDGGITAAIRGWTRALRDQGADVYIAYDPRYEAPARDDELPYVPVEHAGQKRFRRPTGLDALLDDTDLLVLHSAWVSHNVRAAGIARAKGVPYLLEPRGAYDPHIVARRRTAKRVWWTVAEKQLVEGALAVHLFFESEREHLVALGYRGDVVVAPNGVEQRSDMTWEGGEDVVWLGRFDPVHKGLDVLLEALALIDPAERPRVRMYGPDWRGQKAKVAERIAELGLEAHAQVRAPVYGTDKWDVLRRAHGFVYPSRWEGFGIALAEAVTIGTPSLVTTYPLGRFLAERDAVFIAELTPDSLAEGLLALTGSPRRQEVGRNGARVVREELTWEHSARTWLSQVRDLGVAA